MKFRTRSILAGSALLLCGAAPNLHAQWPIRRAASAVEAAAAQSAVSGLQMQQVAVAAAAASELPKQQGDPTTAPVSALPAQQTVAATAALGPKKEGVVRVGVATPVTQMGPGTAGAGVAEPLRALFMQHLAGPTLEAVPLASVEPIQVDAEGKAKSCDYILYSSLSQKKGGGGLSMLRSAAPMLSMVPMVGMAAGVGGMIAGQAASVALSGGVNAASAVKAKSELTLAYRLIRPGVATPVVENSLKAKASADGQDVITPMLSQAVVNALGEIAKQK